MGNLKVGLKRFLSNKNTVTILGVIVGVLVLYFFYYSRVKSAVSPVTVPCAKVEIGSSTLITDDMITYVTVSADFLKKSPNVIRNSSQLINRAVTTGTSVPANGLFYTEQIVDADELPDSVFSDIPDGYTIFSLPVNLTTTYGNSIYPGNYIDIFLKANDNNGKLIYGKFIESIQVRDVKDSAGNHVFNGASTAGVPAVLLFAVPDDMYLLLSNAMQISTNNISLIPVPRNASYSKNPGETTIKSSYLKDFIISKTATIPDQSMGN